MRRKLQGLPPLKSLEISEAKDLISKTVEDKVEQAINELAITKLGKKFTPREIREGLDLLFQKHDFSPIERLIDIAKNTDDEQLEVSICKFLVKFLVPELKSVEVTGQVDHNHTVVIRRFGPDGRIEDAPIRRIPGTIVEVKS